MENGTDQVKSKQRSRRSWRSSYCRAVNAMLDLVKHETERIESRFLEPACGTGNFLGRNFAPETCCGQSPLWQTPS